MADDIDLATQRSDDERHRLITNRARYIGKSAHECTECGNPIPELRRVALPGIQTCVECARAHEMHTQRHRRN